MDEDTIVFVGICAIVVAIFFTICFAIGMDKRQERSMAEKGYCYQSVERAGNPPSWQYQKCK